MNTTIDSFKAVVKNLSDDSLREIYNNLLKINPLKLLLEDRFCIAVVNEWHFRKDPKH